MRARQGQAFAPMCAPPSELLLLPMPGAGAVLISGPIRKGGGLARASPSCQLVLGSRTHSELGVGFT